MQNKTTKFVVNPNQINPGTASPNKRRPIYITQPEQVYNFHHVQWNVLAMLDELNDPTNDSLIKVYSIAQQMYLDMLAPITTLGEDIQNTGTCEIEFYLVSIMNCFIRLSSNHNLDKADALKLTNQFLASVDKELEQSKDFEPYKPYKPYDPYEPIPTNKMRGDNFHVYDVNHKTSDILDIVQLFGIIIDEFNKHEFPSIQIDGTESNPTFRIYFRNDDDQVYKELVCCEKSEWIDSGMAEIHESGPDALARRTYHSKCDCGIVSTICKVDDTPICFDYLCHNCSAPVTFDV